MSIGGSDHGRRTSIFSSILYVFPSHLHNHNHEYRTSASPSPSPHRSAIQRSRVLLWSSDYVSWERGLVRTIMYGDKFSLRVCRSKSRQVCTRGDFPSEQILNGWMEKILLSNKR
jgi:hypothetical protein